MKKLIVYCMVALGGLGVADVKTFRHVFESYPKAEGNCQALARRLADKVSQASGISIPDAACVAQDKYGYRIELSYMAEKPIDFVSTRYRDISLYADRYNDLKQCEDRLAGQVAIFEGATHLKSFVSYCRFEPYSNQDRWSPIIEAVGPAEREPRAGGFMLFTSPKYIPLTEFFEGLEKKFNARGAILGETIVHPQLASYYVTFHYFAKDRLAFWMRETARTTDEKTCGLQAAEAKDFLGRAAESAFVIYCARMGITGEWELTMGFVDEPSFGWRRSIEDFAKLEECESGRSAVVNSYSQAETGILGGLCTRYWRTDRYHVLLFKEGMAFDPIGEP